MELNLFVAYTALCIMAVLPIYYGSFAAIKWPKKRKTKPPSAAQESDSSSEEESVTESLSTHDAYMFPLIGSGVLFGLYLVFRLFNKEYVNYLVTAYFGFLGVAATTTVGIYIVKKAGGVKLDPYKIVITKKAKEIYRFSFSTVQLGVAVGSVFLTIYYVLTKNWIASNILGLSFAFNGIQMLSLDSFKTGMTLLSGLFLYDIFWVFGTEVMVTVAKSFDAPVKVLWPKYLFGLGSDATAEATQFTMLGLGDIVIPGIFVALCLRLDHTLYLKENPNAHRHSKYPTLYFKSCLASYIVGLITTIVVMHTFKAAQPALLYLSPACILSVLLTGLVKGQLNAVFEYSSKENEKKKDDYTRSDNAKKSKDGDKKKKKKKNPKPSPVVKTESSSEGREEDAKDDDRKKKNKKTPKPSPVAKTESSSEGGEEDAKDDGKKKKKKTPKPSPVVKTESSSEGGEEDAKDDGKKKKKKTPNPSPVAKTESSSEEDAKLKPSDNGDGPGAVTGEEDYVEVTSARNRKSKRSHKKK